MNGPRTSGLSPRLAKEYYDLAQRYDSLDSKDINPSLHELASVSRRYSSSELIAEGGMKRIFKVYDGFLKRHLAMATLHENAPRDLADLLIHEAWLTSQLDHPNIITIYDVGLMEGDRPYFTMDLKQGVTLSEFIGSGNGCGTEAGEQDRLNEGLRIFMKICEAISYAHSNHVVHLDLKPANIQIGRHGKVLVCDWGLSMVLGEKGGMQCDRLLFNPDLFSNNQLYGQIKGTVGYMAPEQILGHQVVDPRTDIYGLGGVLYQILAGRAPLTGDVSEVLEKTRKGAIVPPHRSSPGKGVPVALSAVCMKALSVDPEDRYPSVDQLKLEIRRYLEGYATRAEGAGILREIRLFYRRNRRFCMQAAVFSMVIMVGTVWFYGQLLRGKRAASEARNRAEQNLMLYRAGQSDLAKADMENIDSVVRLSWHYCLQGDHRRSLAILRQALDTKPGSPELARAMGQQLFRMQCFNEALPWLERGIHRNDVIHKLAIRYSSEKSDDELLAAGSVIDLVGKLGNTPPDALALVLYDQQRRFDLVERAEVIHAFLRLINPDWKEGWFDYDARQNRLRVGGPNLRKISYVRSVIGGLRLRELDVSDSDVSELWNEDGLALDKLDVSGTRIRDAGIFRRMLHLQELIISEGQFSEAERAKLPREIRVTEVPAPLEA
jgi:serine/threonine-protein kinase